MWRFTEKTSKKIDIIFVFALITLFAATSFVLVLIGAKQYGFVTDTRNENHQDRTTSSYLAEKIRQHDTQNAITICELEGTPALSFLSVEGDVSYTTHIYYYEGALREVVVTEDSVFSPASGQEIIKLQGFTPTFVDDSLLRVEVKDTDGTVRTLYFTIHCSSGKEAL